jgi:hypothetical protein
MLTYERSEILEIVDCSNSDYAGCLDSEKSISGYVFKLVGEAISWNSSKQTVTASSMMMYTEFLACYETTRQTL